MAKKLSISELLRLACLYAEQDRQEYARAVARCADGELAETEEFLRQLQAYRRRRWGKTKLERALAAAVPTSVAEIRKKLL